VHPGDADHRPHSLQLCPDRAALLAEYLLLESEDFQQGLRYAAATVDDERFSMIA
jgi:hypothetical protein